MSRYKRRKYDETIELCDKMLEINSRDQSAWLLKCNSLVRKSYLDDLEIDEDGIGDLLLDENTVSQLARPGTSFQRPMTSSSSGGGINPIIRPMSKSGRPMTGFARPGTNRPLTSSSGNRLETALKGNRPGTTRPITSGGRYMRLGTASLAQNSEQFLQSDKLDMKRIAKKGAVAKSICNYLLYVENNPKKALELAAEASHLSEFKDWWWKERLGKCYSILGLHREAERQFQSSLKNEDVIKTHLQLAKVYTKLDQPITAIEVYRKGIEKHPHEIQFVLGIARIYDQLNHPAKAVEFYKQVLEFESSNMEAVASIAAYQFYADQPEVSTRFYQRLLQLGIQTAEIWNNLGLCLLFDGQYDLFYPCFERAIQLADDSNRADIWYNISHIFIHLGEMGLAHQCLKMVIDADPHHAEAYNNLGVIEIKNDNIEKGKFELLMAMKEGEMLLEPHFNAAMWAFNTSEFESALKLVNKALNIYPEHEESIRLKKQIEAIFKVF